MLRNVSSKVNVRELKDRLANKKVILVKELPDDFIYDLRKYFDIIITDNEASLYRTNADIFIDTKESIYVKNTFNDKIFKKHRDTLFCVNFKLLKQLQKSNKRLDNYVLACGLVKSDPRKTLLLSDGVKMGISGADPSLHIALFSGATDLYSTYETKHTTQLVGKVLDEYMTDQLKIRGVATGHPKNQIHKERKNFIRNW